MRYLLLLFTCLSFQSFAAPTMRVHYIDVGQADATLLEFSCGIILIDAGAQVGSGAKLSSRKLINYLDDFFASRADKTIHSIIITHNHNDHTDSLDEVIDNYDVKNLISTENEINSDITYAITEPGINHRYLTYEDAISKIPNGMYYSEIDPFDCDGNGPEIKIFTGKVEITGRTTVNGVNFYPSHFNSKNNHSLVITVRYGKASFIFTGDLQEKGINYLLSNYNGHHDLFDADVYQAGHHGSHNATNAKLLTAISPKIAVISAGKPGEKTMGSAWDYGHPNKHVIDLLLGWNTINNRSNPLYGNIYDGQETLPLRYKINNKTYCTCWENNIVIEADAETGVYNVMTNQ